MKWLWTRFQRTAPEPGSRVSKEHVVWAYRLLLDREPESEEVVRATAAVHPTTWQLRAHILASAEYRSNNPEPGAEPPSAGDLPVPPPDLVYLVSGTRDLRWFLRGGELAAAASRSALSRQGVDLGDLEAILDLGCGCGRVLRHLAGLGPGVLHGVDYNPDLVAWCRDHLPGMVFAVNRLTPPLAAAEGAFDLVYALSVLTHLPADLQAPWMGELARVLRPGGHAIVTVHGTSYLDELDDAERQRFAAGELVVRAAEAAGSNRCGAFHPAPYLARLAADAGLAVVEHRPEGATGNPHQDLVVLRRGRGEVPTRRPPAAP